MQMYLYISMIEMVKVVYACDGASTLRLILGIAGYLHQTAVSGKNVVQSRLAYGLKN